MHRTHPPSLLTELRDATYPQHERLHQNPLLSRLLRETCTRADPLRVLAIFQRFYGPYEQAQHANDSVHFAFEATPLVWLARDLKRLGSSAMAHFHGPPYEPLTCLPNLEAHLAYLYLKQGSGLGGQMISRRLKQNNVLKVGEECEFF